MFKSRKFLFLLGSFALLTGATTTMASASSTIHQKGNALTGAVSKKVVNNKNYATIPAYSYTSSKDYISSSTYQTKPDTYKFKAGNFKRNAQTFMYLPVSHNYSGDIANPQSAVQSPDGHYVYVMYSLGNNSIIRYDLWKLHDLGVNTDHMDSLRRGINTNPQIKAAIKYGSKFSVGHGQSLSYNPKNNKLYFFDMLLTTNKPTLVEINPDTLKVTKKISFKLNNNDSINNELTFDKHGNFYTYIKHMNKGKVAGGITIYKGQLKGNRVHMESIQQGLAHAPGDHTQGMGYNPKSNRLYFVSDGAITSVPVNKLGHLKPNDVRTTKWDVTREFEGISFTKSGRGLILMNRGAELVEVKDF
ncbi:hypothetical protein MOO46_06105 [Apilactobacillus apisilvae]|uniref:Extracellular protein n=1 Tax=Apilactobacillus apisilvae TaxID=2923364 RepID=A0ABY4PH52_9LACO|nr:hypothetical protein [Apilactobacillus apisilvae]UQS84816.1 hypothetical protein MOO46_06105 [Apilactobacillus apisilvae]